MKLNFRHSESTVKPESVEISSTTVFLRKDIAKEKRTDELGKSTIFWTYQEAKMTPDEFVAYAGLISAKDTVSNVTIDNQLAIMGAIADLYDEISKIRGGIS